MKQIARYLLPLLAACGSAARDTSDPGRGYYPSSGNPDEPVVAGSVARGPACSFYPCVDICGERIAVALAEPAFGFTEAGSMPWLLGRGNLLSGDRLLTVNGMEAEIRDASDLSLLGRVPVPSANESAALEDVALVQGTGGALAVLDVAGAAPNMRSWWFNTAESEPLLQLLGAAAGHFVLRTPKGLSFVDVADGQPREVSCLQPPAGREWWNMVLTGDALGIAEAAIGTEPEQARLYRLTAEGSVDLGLVPMETEGPIGGADGRISVTWLREHLTVYDVAGESAVEVAAVEGLFGTSATAPFGGFQFFEAFTSERKAVDLRDSFEVFDAETVVDAPCLLRLEGRDSSEAFIVSPLWPDARLPAEPAPSVTCPARREPYTVEAAALSADGSTLLFNDSASENWVFRDLASGSERPGPSLPEQQVVFWGADRIVLLATGGGGDYGLASRTTVTVVSSADPYPVLATFATPGPVLDWRATATDVWALSYANEFEYEERAPATLHLLRIDPNTSTPEATVIRTLPNARQQLAVFGDRAYVLSDRTLAVIARDGTTLQELSLSAGAFDVAASELGFFMSDADRVWWLVPGADELAVLIDDCNGCRVQGADATRVYTTAHAPRDAHHPLERRNDGTLGYTELRAYQASGGALIGRHPLPALPSALLLGADRVVVLASTVNVLAPPPPP